MKTINEIAQRLRAEYIEMPGLALTAEQVQRLYGIEQHVCRSVLDALINAQFLAPGPNGQYARPAEGRIRNARPQSSASTGVKADSRRPSVHGESHERGERFDGQRDAVEGEGREGRERPERRRARSDVELRAEHAELERLWNERD